MEESHGLVASNYLLRGSVGGCQVLLVDANSAREMFSSGAETVWEVCGHWQYSLVGGIFLLVGII